VIRRRGPARHKVAPDVGRHWSGATRRLRHNI